MASRGDHHRQSVDTEGDRLSKSQKIKKEEMEAVAAQMNSVNDAQSTSLYVSADKPTNLSANSAEMMNGVN